MLLYFEQSDIFYSLFKKARAYEDFYMNEPFFKQILKSPQQVLLQQMRDKSSFQISQSANLLGMADYTKTLKPGQVFIKINSLKN